MSNTVIILIILNFFKLLTLYSGFILGDLRGTYAIYGAREGTKVSPMQDKRLYYFYSPKEGTLLLALFYFNYYYNYCAVSILVLEV